MSSVDTFHTLPDQPDEPLKTGLKTVDGRLLHLSLADEPEVFINKLMRGSSKMMLSIFMDDHEGFKTDPKSTPEAIVEAKKNVVMLYNKFLETNKS